MHSQPPGPAYEVPTRDERLAKAVCPVPLLEFRDIGFGFGESPCGLFGEVNLELRPGEVVAIQGDNGTGKSCMARLAMGLYRPRVGRVRLFGRPPGHHDQIPKLGFVGGLPQADGDLPMPPDLSVPLFRRVVTDALDEAGADLDWVGEVAEKMEVDAPEARSKKFGQLSKGWQLRFQWWAALAKPARLLILDEPFDGLSKKIKPVVFGLLREVIHRQGAAVFLVTHHPSEAFKAGAERLFEIADHRLREVSPGEFRVSVVVDGEEQVHSSRTLSAQELYEMAEEGATSGFQSCLQLSAYRVIGDEG